MGAGRFSAGSGDRRQVEAELVTRLRQLPVGELPDERFKAELRSQLVAITPRIVAESAPTGDKAVGQPVRAGRLATFRRPLIALTGAACVLALLLGLAVWMAHGALPGESLYGIKRASENFQLSVAGSDTDKGMKYLKFAASRAQESDKLAGSAQSDPHAASLITSALRSADGETRSGVRLLTSAAVSQTSPDPMAKIPSWVTEQRARIAALVPQLPAGPARNQATASLTLLQQVATRVSQLKAELGCACLSQANSDELGPKPCPSCQKRPNTPGLPGGSGLPTAPGSGTSGLPPLPTGTLPTSPSGGVSLPGLGGGGSTGAALPSSVPSGLPGGSQLPSSPVSAGTGGVSVGLPGLSISAGPGGISISAGPTLP
jgi:hypothetical protein